MVQTILIHADGTIQVHPARGKMFRLETKWFKLAEQPYNEEELGPFVYTECSPPTNVMASNVIPFRPRQTDIDRDFAQGRWHLDPTGEVHVN